MVSRDSSDGLATRVRHNEFGSIPGRSYVYREHKADYRSHLLLRLRMS